MAPLVRPDCPPEVRQQIESAIRQRVVDLPALAQCPTLPADHPLRVAAGVLWQALEAVTSGPVSDDRLALPEVPRRGPLGV